VSGQEEKWDNIEVEDDQDHEGTDDDSAEASTMAPHPANPALVEANAGEVETETEGEESEDGEDGTEDSELDAKSGEGTATEPASANHPANPATYPIPPKQPLSVWVDISNAERIEKGELWAKKTIEIEKMEAERSEITAEIGKAKKQAIVLRNAFLSGKVEVPAEQQDLLRQPVSAQTAAAEFGDMAEAAERANQETEATATNGQEGQESSLAMTTGESEASKVARAAEQQSQEGAQQPGPNIEELNKMAADIQAGKPGTEPGPEFLNSIENHKAKSAAKRKGKT
jgi:hypothetical protein